MSGAVPSGLIQQPNTLHLKLKLTCRDNVPLVHGRSNASLNVKTRLSNHQRNLSLDFRSMGILLPPVTQVTTATTNHLTTHHHRNRSLDSALQRIPEVDVTPSPECENVTAILCAASSGSAESRPTSSSKQHSDELASLGSDDSGILCCSDAGSSSDSTATRESSVEYIDKLESGRADGTRDDVADDAERTRPDSESSKGFGMLRLLESKVFDVSMAMHYLFNSKEPGVLCYIVNKMFSFDDREVDFYLPQLVCMYIQMHDVAEVIHRYLIHRCRKSIDFSLKCAWLLDAFSSDASLPTKKKPHGVKLRNLILSDELRPKDHKIMTTSLNLSLSNNDKLSVPTTNAKKSHQRSHSDASALLPGLKKNVPSTTKLCLGDLSSGRAFDNGCICFESCQSVVNDLRGEKTECTCSEDLEQTVYEWNTHNISGTLNAVSPIGRPAIMFELPELYNTIDFVCDTEDHLVEACESQCVFHKLPCEADIFELCTIIRIEKNIQVPKDPYAAADLYIQLRAKLNSECDIY